VNPRRLLRYLLLGIITVQLVSIMFLMVTRTLYPDRNGAATLDGVTLCFPLIGPVQNFDRTLPDSLLQLARVHESVHAIQCRQMGAVANFVVRVGRKGRLRMEAQAYCAQAKVELSWGLPAATLAYRIQEELIMSVEHITFGRVSKQQVREILLTECPALAPPRPT
jgi:hypothetical protein